MTVHEAIQKRFSARSYLDKPVEQEKLERVLEAARLAPSAGNRQEWRFVVVRDAATRKLLADAANGQAFVGQAPVVIAACAAGEQHVMSCGQLCYPIDVAIALEHIALQATEEGLGTCWIGAFKEDEVRKILGIPADVRVVELMPLGYPATDGSPKRRLSSEEIVKWEKWS
ncbi:MAG: nitroreductase [candidate division WS1 bacterium]|jgi:nitroreductase|nr:nitroreductase [candidate division WS1 bacterium]